MDAGEVEDVFFSQLECYGKAKWWTNLITNVFIYRTANMVMAHELSHRSQRFR